MTSDCIPHQVLVLRQFFEAMADKPDRVTYGLRHVRYATEQVDGPPPPSPNLPHPPPPSPVNRSKTHCATCATPPAEQGAIDRLLLADTLFRAQHVQRRAQYVALVEAAKAAGAAVHIFSDLHASGEQLAGLGGVAALLRYPMPQLDELMQEENEGDVGEGEDGSTGGGHTTT